RRARRVLRRGAAPEVSRIRDAGLPDDDAGARYFRGTGASPVRGARATENQHVNDECPVFARRAHGLETRATKGRLRARNRKGRFGLVPFRSMAGAAVKRWDVWRLCGTVAAGAALWAAVALLGSC